MLFGGVDELMPAAFREGSSARGVPAAFVVGFFAVAARVRGAA
jgi:hypothetical protein